jgi:hypothetical protein
VVVDEVVQGPFRLHLHDVHLAIDDQPDLPFLGRQGHSPVTGQDVMFQLVEGVEPFAAVGAGETCLGLFRHV